MTRRDFLKTSVRTAALAGVGGLGTFAPRMARAGASPSTDLIPIDPEIEPLVRLITTSDDRLIPVMIDQVRQGLSYRRFLAANFITAIRYQAEPHRIFVTHSVNEVAQELGRNERFLPLFYHLENVRPPLFYHAENARSTSWTPRMRPISDEDLPPPRRAASLFTAAMQNGDQEAATRALLALARAEGPRRAFDKLWFYAAERNHISGGHTAIAVANAFRTLETIGWQHAEPALYFLAEQCSTRPGGSDLHHVNAERAKTVAELPPDWSRERSNRTAVLELLELYRQGVPERSCQATYERLHQGSLQAGTVWDAVFLTTAESMIRFRWCAPSRLCGHSVTCSNALHYAFRTVTDPETRLYTLLEAVEWTTSFLQREHARGGLREARITEIPPVDSPPSDREAIEQIFALLPPRRFSDTSRIFRADQDRAMELTYSLARRSSDHHLFLQTARRLLCLKSTREVHDFKYPVALFEHYQHVSPEWKPNILAASAHYLHGTRMDDCEAVREAREALG
jgi:hypothetical protein